MAEKKIRFVPRREADLYPKVKFVCRWSLFREAWEVGVYWSRADLDKIEGGELLYRRYACFRYYPRALRGIWLQLRRVFEISGRL